MQNVDKKKQKKFLNSEIYLLSKLYYVLLFPAVATVFGIFLHLIILKKLPFSRHPGSDTQIIGLAILGLIFVISVASALYSCVKEVFELKRLKHEILEKKNIKLYSDFEIQTTKTYRINFLISLFFFTAITLVFACTVSLKNFSLSITNYSSCLVMLLGICMLISFISTLAFFRKITSADPVQVLYKQIDDFCNETSPKLDENVYVVLLRGALCARMEPEDDEYGYKKNQSLKLRLAFVGVLGIAICGAATLYTNLMNSQTIEYTLDSLIGVLFICVVVSVCLYCNAKIRRNLQAGNYDPNNKTSYLVVQNSIKQILSTYWQDMENDNVQPESQRKLSGAIVDFMRDLRIYQVEMKQLLEVLVPASDMRAAEQDKHTSRYDRELAEQDESTSLYKAPITDNLPLSSHFILQNFQNFYGVNKGGAIAFPEGASQKLKSLKQFLSTPCSKIKATRVLPLHTRLDRGNNV